MHITLHYIGTAQNSFGHYYYYIVLGVYEKSGISQYPPHEVGNNHFCFVFIIPFATRNTIYKMYDCSLPEKNT